MVLPQLHPGVRSGLPFGEQAQGSAVGLDRQHGAGGEVDAHPNDVRGIHPGFPQQLWYGTLKDPQVVLRILQRPIRLERYAALGQRLVDHPVGVGIDRRGYLLPRVNLHQHGPPGLGAKVNPDCVFHECSPVSAYW